MTYLKMMKVFKGVWLAMEEMRTASFEALAEATAAMRSVDERAQQSQDDSHLRIMMYQLSANDYVPARSRIDVAGRLRELDEQRGQRRPVARPHRRLGEHLEAGQRRRVLLDGAAQRSVPRRRQ